MCHTQYDTLNWGFWHSPLPQYPITPIPHYPITLIPQLLNAACGVYNKATFHTRSQQMVQDKLDKPHLKKAQRPDDEAVHVSFQTQESTATF